MGWVHLTELGESFINSSAEGEMSDQLMRYLNVLYTVLEENMKGMPISEDEIAERLSNLYPKDQVKKYVSLLAEKKAIEITGQKGGIDEGVYLMNPIPGVDYKIDSIMDRFAKEQKEPEKIKQLCMNSQNWNLKKRNYPFAFTLLPLHLQERQQIFLLLLNR